jgi:thioredoxin-related protein
MRTVVAFLLVILGVSYGDISWYGLNDGFKKAQKEKKPVMIYIYSPKCHYCKEMDATTFKDKKVQELVNRYFVPIKIRKCSEDGMFVRAEYGYLGTPTFHFVSPDGEKIKSIFGAWPKEDFLKILGYFYTGAYKTKSMTEYFMEEQ